MYKKPSVTTLCSILNKPALLYWANKIGMQGESLKYHKLKSTHDGKRKHQEIESLLIDGEPMEDQIMQDKVMSIFESCEIVGVEVPFENDMYKGRCDLLYKKDGLLHVADFKRKFKRPYLEHYLQLVAYKRHYNADRMEIISLDNMMIHDLTTENEGIYWEIIKNLTNIHNLKNEIL